jgi:para-nitrobenzyl esterase
MNKLSFILLTLFAGSTAFGQLNDETSLPMAKTADGMLEGINSSDIHTFKGIPFAQPPVGDLGWKEPQPVKHWEGVRKADHFGPTLFVSGAVG